MCGKDQSSPGLPSRARLRAPAVCLFPQNGPQDDPLGQELRPSALHGDKGEMPACRGCCQQVTAAGAGTLGRWDSMLSHQGLRPTLWLWPPIQRKAWCVTLRLLAQAGGKLVRKQDLRNPRAKSFNNRT